jgi:hypothetical protein
MVWSIVSPLTTKPSAPWPENICPPRPWPLPSTTPAPDGHMWDMKMPSAMCSASGFHQSCRTKDVSEPVARLPARSGPFGE